MSSFLKKALASIKRFFKELFNEDKRTVSPYERDNHTNDLTSIEKKVSKVVGELDTYLRLNQRVAHQLHAEARELLQRQDDVALAAERARRMQDTLKTIQE